MTDKQQFPLRLDKDLAEEAAATARIQGRSVNALVGDALRREIDRVATDPGFMAKAREVLLRDKAILDRLARR